MRESRRPPLFNERDCPNDSLSFLYYYLFPLPSSIYHLPSTIFHLTGDWGAVSPLAARRLLRFRDSIPVTLTKYRFVACKVPLRRLRGPISPVARAYLARGG